MKLKIRKFCSTSMAISAVGKKIGIRMIRNSGMRFAILNKIVSVDLTEITFAQRTGGRKGARESRKGAEHSRQREQPVQSPWVEACLVRMWDRQGDPNVTAVTGGWGAATVGFCRPLEDLWLKFRVKRETF